MAYSELIKNFNLIREYMRDFYVFGFKSRDDFTQKSARSYDDEKRRLESWLGDYMRFRQTADGKNVFLSIDSRVSHHNPLYTAWKAKSFTDGDITLHFLLLDVLCVSGDGVTLAQVCDCIAEYLPDSARIFDESTVRKKLKEYCDEGIVCTEKRGKTTLYFRTENADLTSCNDALDFFSEVAPCGVVGSFLLDKIDSHDQVFAFKHHYITSALDSEIVCSLFEAMHEKRYVTLQTFNRRKDRMAENNVVPLQIMMSVQSGRQYLMAYAPSQKRVTSFRIDNVLSLKTGETCYNFDYLRSLLDKMRDNMWGVSTQSDFGGRLEHVDFTVKFSDSEQHIYKRLLREKRCGTVEKIDEHTCKFSADVYDVTELIPWIRTFICRITDLHFSNPKIQTQFWDDVHAMYQLYDLYGGDCDDIQ